jgi:hypothetical protein
VLLGSADGTVHLYQLSGKRLLQTFLHSARQAADPNSSAAADTGMDTVEEGSDEERVNEGALWFQLQCCNSVRVHTVPCSAFEDTFTVLFEFRVFLCLHGARCELCVRVSVTD